MKILLSAYACEPYKGSEPNVGWNWAITLASTGHFPWVITRENNKPNITAALKEIPRQAQPIFCFYDLPHWARWWKKGNKGIRIYYFLWQLGAYRLAKKVNAQEHFDCVHHVTFVGVRQPSFMGNLGIPFIFGPVGGGEKAPRKLRRGYGWRGQLADLFRDVTNYLIKFNPLMLHTFNKAYQIYVTSEQTRKLLPKKYWPKTHVKLAIGWEKMPTASVARKVNNKYKESFFQVLYVGQFIHWKGMHLGLKAFAILMKIKPNAHLTMVGQGPCAENWKQLSRHLGIEKSIDWIPWVERDTLPEIYAKHDVFLYPSLHDSGGMVVLEALAHGLPVVCLDLGGPGTLVNSSCGYVIKTKSAEESEVEKALARSLFLVANDRSLRQELSKAALLRSEEFAWDEKILSIYKAQS